jgi:hypothetical protein
MKITPKMFFKGICFYSLLFSFSVLYFSYTAFQSYTLEKASKHFRQVTSFTKIGESLSKITVGGGCEYCSGTDYYNPCVVLKIDGASSAIKACKKDRVVRRLHIQKEEAEEMLKTEFANTASFMVYVSDDNTHAFLDPYTEKGEKDDLFDFCIVAGVSLVVCLFSILLWFYDPDTHSKKKKKKKKKKAPLPK